MFEIAADIDIYKNSARGLLPYSPASFDIGLCDGLFLDHMKSKSAKYLIILANKMGGWKRFSRRDIQKLYEKFHPNKLFLFNGLLNDKLILRDADGGYHYTIKFVEYCFKQIKSLEI